MPATSPVVQKVRRRPCGLIGWAMPAAQHRDREGDVGRLGALAEHVQKLVAGLVAQVGDVRPAGLGHPQPEHP